MPFPTSTTGLIGRTLWNALVAFVNGLETAISQKASTGDLANHIASTAAHGATSSPNASTIVRRDIDGGTSLTALALTDTTPNAGQAPRRDYVDAAVTAVRDAIDVTAADLAAARATLTEALARIDALEGSGGGGETANTLVTLDGSGPATTWTNSNTKGFSSTPFYIENNGSELQRTGGGTYRQPDQGQFRAWLQSAHGGPAQPRVRMKVHARVTALGGADGGIVEGLKLMMKAVHPEHPQGILDPDAARGIDPWNIGPGGKSVTPGSMYAFGLTRGGYVEISKHQFGIAEYVFGTQATRPFTIGQWYDLAVEVEWLTNPDRVRITSYRDGAPELTWTDTGQTGAGNYDGGRPFMQPFFFGLRSDDAPFEFDNFVLETF